MYTMVLNHQPIPITSFLPLRYALCHTNQRTSCQLSCSTLHVSFRMLGSSSNTIFEVLNKFDALSSTPEDVDTSWNSFCLVITSAATEGHWHQEPQPKPETLAILEQKVAVNKCLANAKRPCDCHVLCLRLKSSLCSCAHSI